MTKIQYLTMQAVDELQNGIEDQLEWYAAPKGVVPVDLSADKFRDTMMEFDDQALKEVLCADTSKDSTQDKQCALMMYKVLGELTPHQATDKRFWIWLSHYHYANYITRRWQIESLDDEAAKRKKVLAHYFVQDTRSIIRDHGLSRLWWLGRTASVTYPDAPEKFLEIVLHRQDIRSALIERPSLSMNIEVLRQIFEIMLEQWNAEERSAILFKREVFRKWMTRMNSRGGVVLLDALPKKELRRVLLQEKDRAIKEDSM